MRASNIRGDTMKKIYAGIDIGSDTIKMVVCELYKNKYNVLAASSVKANGVKGLIVNAEEVTESLKACLKEIEEMLGVKVDKVVAIVPSYFANFMLVEGYTTVYPEREVKGVDIVRALPKLCL